MIKVRCQDVVTPWEQATELRLLSDAHSALAVGQRLQLRKVESYSLREANFVAPLHTPYQLR